MKTLTKAVCYTAFAAVTTLLPLQAAVAQESNMQPQPAVVVSIASVEEMNADVRHLMKAAGMEAFGDLAVGMADQYTQHIDKQTPMGAYVTLDGFEPTVVMFMPVSDLDAMLGMFAAEFGDVEEMDGGVKMIATPSMDVFMKQSGEFAFASNLEENLDMLPADPVSLLDGMNDEYNLAVRVFAQNVPNQLKQMAIGFMEEGFNDAVESMEAIDPEAAKFQREMNQVSLQSMKELIEDTDQVTIGMAIDALSSSTYLDFVVTGLPDSKFAEQVAQAGGVETRFAGFLSDDPAASVHFASKMSQEDVAAIDTMMGGMRDQVMQQIEDEGDLTAEQVDLAQEVAGKLLDVFQSTMKSGVVDGGAKVVLTDDTTAFAAGLAVADGLKIEQAAKELVEVAKADAPPEVVFNLDAEVFQGVNMHLITVPVPESEEEVRNVVGDKMTLVLGTSEDAFYIAGGKNAVSLLKTCMNASESAEVEGLPTSQLNISLGKVLGFASSVQEDPIVMMLADMLEGSENDKIRVYSMLIENGAKSRLEIQDDVIKLIGTAGMQLGGGAGPGF